MSVATVAQRHGVHTYGDHVGSQVLYQFQLTNKFKQLWAVDPFMHVSNEGNAGRPQAMPQRRAKIMSQV